MMYITAILAVFLTRFLSQIRKVGSVLASAISSMLLICILEILGLFTSIDINSYSQMVFAASFIGMTTHERLTNIEIFSSPILMIIIYNYIPIEYKSNTGGALGFSAFLSVALYIAVKKLAYSKFFSSRFN